ncbi:hypothetical protein LOTGIDRAFT_157642 [Lottia gigantea]|uniref:EF-hand domain-containing protein n=1 Tax=Lottia gigantea TaxID=225164 RepID=V4B5W1_LOTGI|nr:hypothetical protein LOTGIDRAFT_157642 [Lottia gigantea]ESP01457.1 hypothetical protein LOTGIDRAFT_157642 [Lottia gigantea]
MCLYNNTQGIKITFEEQWEAVTGIINFLDPDAKGVITFDDFCEGVQQIQDLQAQVHTSLNGNCSLRRGCSEDTLVPTDNISNISPISPHKCECMEEKILKHLSLFSWKEVCLLQMLNQITSIL